MCKIRFNFVCFSVFSAFLCVSSVFAQSLLNPGAGSPHVLGQGNSNGSSGSITILSPNDFKSQVSNLDQQTEEALKDKLQKQLSSKEGFGGAPQKSSTGSSSLSSQQNAHQQSTPPYNGFGATATNPPVNSSGQSRGWNISY